MAEKSKRKKKKSAFSRAMGSLFPQKGDGILESIRKIVFLISVIVFAVCAYLIFDYFYENYQNRQLYEGIADIYVEAEKEEIPEENTEEEKELHLLSGAESLLGVNPDTVGYINIPGTVISYPIVQKTTKEESEYYLHINFMNQEAKAGAIFLDWRNQFNAEGQSDNLIIYGHDMKDGSMFGTLRNYKKDDYVEFYKNHAVIELNSNYEEAEYKIFGCFIIDAGLPESEIFDYYNYIDFSGEQEFYYYVNEIKKRSLILNDVDVKYGDKLVILSTCSQEFPDSRFVIAARKFRDGETAEEGTQNAWENDNPLMPDRWYNVKGGKRYDPDAEFIPYGE